MTPRDTVFAILSFEGPDVYSQAGGLGTRCRELARALAQKGYTVHFYFIGDPALPGEEIESGVTLHRWGQWISRHHPGGVYDGEDGKVADWNRSLPSHLVEQVIRPAAAGGRATVVLAEEWHTAWSVSLLCERLREAGLRDRVTIMWNANNVFGFGNVDFAALTRDATITTVSRYMKQRMAGVAPDAIVIPNGIPAAAVRQPDGASVGALRSAMGTDLFLFKIGRFDPDKRWLMAVTAAALLRQSGHAVRMLIRGSRDPHGAEVIGHARRMGLTVADVPGATTAEAMAREIRRHPTADLLQITSFVPDELVSTIYGAADAVLANSGHEPFGLVGLEVMAAGGIAFTGATGEDYAQAYRNCLVIDTHDAREIGAMLLQVQRSPRLRATIRAGGIRTAREFTWDRVLGQLLPRIEYASTLQGQRSTRLPAPRPPDSAN